MDNDDRIGGHTGYKMSPYATWIERHPYGATSGAVVRSGRLDKAFLVAVAVRGTEYGMFGHAPRVLRSSPCNSVLLRRRCTRMSNARLRNCWYRIGHARLGVAWWQSKRIVSSATITCAKDQLVGKSSKTADQQLTIGMMTICNSCRVSVYGCRFLRFLPLPYVLIRRAGQIRL